MNYERHLENVVIVAYCTNLKKLIFRIKILLYLIDL